MLKYQEVDKFILENEKVFICKPNGKKSKVRAKNYIEFLTDKIKKEWSTFDIVDAYNDYKRECKRAKQFKKARHLVDYSPEFHSIFSGSIYRKAFINYVDLYFDTKIRKDGKKVKGTIYVLDKNTKKEDLKKLHDTFDNLVVIEYKNGGFGVFIGKCKLRNY